ncbi:hypothetical protein EDC01DRAFT_763465 [Geopyxis carbonaria]|nr:hypothetical protein EDC01DRAFT_763465 [Geopyxis carbonaria]
MNEQNPIAILMCTWEYLSSGLASLLSSRTLTLIAIAFNYLCQSLKLVGKELYDMATEPFSALFPSNLLVDHKYTPKALPTTLEDTTSFLSTLKFYFLLSVLLACTIVLTGVANPLLTALFAATTRRPATQLNPIPPPRYTPGPNWDYTTQISLTRAGTRYSRKQFSTPPTPPRPMEPLKRLPRLSPQYASLNLRPDGFRGATMPVEDFGAALRERKWIEEYGVNENGNTGLGIEILAKLPRNQDMRGMFEGTSVWEREGGRGRSFGWR